MLAVQKLETNVINAPSYRSIIGDSGMASEHLRVEFEAWNFCNGARGGPSNLPSPRSVVSGLFLHRLIAFFARYADCFDTTGEQLVSETANGLRPSDPLPHFPPTQGINLRAFLKCASLINAIG